MHRPIAGRLEDDTEQAARYGEVPLPESVTGITCKRGVQDTQDLRALFEPVRDPQTRLKVSRQSNTERAQAAEREVHVVGSDTKAHRIDGILERRRSEERRVGKE